MLRLQYPQYFLPPKDEPGDCHCKKCHGQDTADYESWTSGVYPVEEEVETDLGILTTETMESSNKVSGMY